jgi:hypothetical protein
MKLRREGDSGSRVGVRLIRAREVACEGSLGALLVGTSMFGMCRLLLGCNREGDISII